VDQHRVWLDAGVEQKNGVPTAYYKGSSSPDCTAASNSCQAITNEDVEIYSHWLT
jgi:hypothetical protein